MRPSLAPVSITGTTLASALGNTVSAATQAIKTGRSSLHKQHRFTRHPDVPLGEIDFADFVDEARLLGANDTLFTRMVCGSLRRLADQTQLFSRYKPEEIGFYFGTTTAGIEQSSTGIMDYSASQRMQRPQTLTWQHQPAFINRLVRQLFPIAGFGTVITTACSSGALAIALGQQAIASNSVKACVVGGFDVLCAITIAGFESLQILDHSFCRPFGSDRAGINLSEGGAFLLLEASPHPDKQPLAYLVGSGASTDAFHITKPDPDGYGMELCMRNALKQTNIAANRISYINAHGTGTMANDEAESKAINRVFGSSVPVSSTKGFHGHALGGTGALEAALAVAALSEQTTWGGRPVEAQPLQNLIKLEFKSTDRPVDYVLSNSFGFGGNNTSLIFAREGRS